MAFFLDHTIFPIKGKPYPVALTHLNAPVFNHVFLIVTHFLSIFLFFFYRY